MCWGFPIEWMGVFPITAAHQGLQFRPQEGDKNGVEGVDKVPRLFFFFYQTVTLSECFSGPKQD